MPALSFSVFRDKILRGSKRQTIRAVRKNPIKEGETLYLWWKQRSAQREKLGEAKCISVVPLTIKKAGFMFGESTKDWDVTFDEFAQADGFDNWQQLVEFFENTHGLPFEGVLIQWGELNLEP